jgi:hypothetical protein
MAKQYIVMRGKPDVSDTIEGYKVNNIYDVREIETLYTTARKDGKHSLANSILIVLRQIWGSKYYAGGCM